VKKVDAGIASQQQAMTKIAFPETFCVFQKDSKTITQYNPVTKEIRHQFIEFRGNFPHNFQMV